MTKPTLDFETFFATSLDLLVIRDAALKIVKVNQAWERVLGYRKDELEGQPMLSFIHPDDVAASHAQMQRVEIEKDVNGIINRYRCRDGSYRYLEWRAHQEGNLVYGVARDVTDRLAIESEMAEAKAAAETANKAKSEFLANMSHELRTPLNAVIGFSELMMHKTFGPLSERYAEYAGLINDAGTHLLSLVSDILDLAKIEAGRFTPDFQSFDLKAPALACLALIRRRADERHISVTTKLPEGELMVEADSRAIKQILLNLLSNAVKFSRDGGEITLTLAAVQGGVEIKVRDEGIGIPADVLARIGQPFEQASNNPMLAREGTGLGLALVKALAAEHGGKVTVASQENVGTEITVVLPRRQDARAARAAA